MNTANHSKETTKAKVNTQVQLEQEDFDFLRASVVMFKSAKESVNCQFWYSIIRAYSLYIQEKNGLDTSDLDLCFDHIKPFEETEDLPNDSVCSDNLMYYEKIFAGLNNPRVMHYLKLICEKVGTNDVDDEVQCLHQNPA